MSGTTLKYIMMFLMVLDHIPYFVPEKVWIVFHVLSRCVAPFFAYMTVEGFIHTRSRPRYIKRLFFWAAVMFAGNVVLNSFVIREEAYYIGNNIFLTFACSVLLLYLIENVKQHERRVVKVFSAIAACAVFYFALSQTEGGIFIPTLILITYYFRENHRTRNLLYVLLSLLMFALELGTRNNLGAGVWDFLRDNATFLFITFLPFIYIYNGERGKNNKFTKYSFYIFYPAHVWLITITAWLLELPAAG